jgi:hypothetical protein
MAARKTAKPDYEGILEVLKDLEHKNIRVGLTLLIEIVGQLTEAVRRLAGKEPEKRGKKA